MQDTPVAGREMWRSQAGIPIRSLWALLVYAHGLANFLDRFDGEAEDSADLPELLARLLTVVVERRLRRNLTRAYQPRAAVIGRVRGRIDRLQTESRLLLHRGEVACRYEDLTANTARNRLVHAALEACAGRVSDMKVAHGCRTLARDLDRLGVGACRPSHAELARDQNARNDADDRLVVAVALLALDLVLPAETAGDVRATRLQRDEALLRQIFEAAVAGFYDHELHGREGWRVHPQRQLLWRTEAPTLGLAALFPSMYADIVMERAPTPERAARRLVIDTKFTGVVTRNQHGAERFKSSHIYQMYAYLRSQEEAGASALAAAGLLLHPALDVAFDESATVQGHRIRFATVDLWAPPDVWRRQLLALVH